MPLPSETAHALRAIQPHLHALIRDRAGDLIDRHAVALPDLVDTLADGRTAWFPVPGMYGGFSYRLAEADGPVTLLVESWCRVVEGSGQRHHVTAAGARMVAEGFV